jgi:thiamine kinase-like enzyme
VTNRVWRVGDVALRQGHPQATALGIDRCREWHVLQRLRRHGIGPEPLRFDRQRDLAAFTWLAGESGAPEAEAARALLQRLHALPRCGQRFSPAATIAHYRALLEGRLPAALRELSDRCEETSWMLEETAELRLCHNDCVAKNWLHLEDGSWRLIDFEFAGDNDPAFDFATLSLDVDLGPLPERVAAYRPVVDCLWTLYCLVLAELDEAKREPAQRQARERCARLGILLERQGR